MKKYLFIIATAATVVSCSNTDSVKQIVTEDTPIAFSGYTQSITKAENNPTDYDWQLKDHHLDFVVYGYKTANNANTKVFNQQKVEWDTSLDPDAWNYTPARYWDKAASTYYFYAAAPSQITVSGETVSCPWTLVASTTDIDDDYFTYTGFTLADHDATTSGNTYVQSFKNCATAAKDLMIAAPCPWTDYTQKVTLQFNHILSRLNVLIKRGTNLDANDVVKVKDFKVFNLYSTGDFDESETLVATAPGTNGRWDNQSGSVNYTSTNEADFVVNSWTWGTSEDGNYILQALVVPQTITFHTIKHDGSDASSSTTPNAYFMIEYEISNDTWTGDKTENYKAYFNLAAAFGATADDPNTANVNESEIDFNEGWQNNLILNINPDKIEFDAEVSKWGDNTYELTPQGDIH